jgi:hypothetical protein
MELFKLSKYRKESKAAWSFSALKKSDKLAVHNQKQFGSKVLGDLRKLLAAWQE